MFSANCEMTGITFVDDSSLGVTSTYAPPSTLSATEQVRAEASHTIQLLSNLAQHWERLLFSTGGAINLQKSHWYIMTWNWLNGKAHLATAADAPGSISLTTGDNTYRDIIPRLAPTDSFRTLGVYLSPSGTQRRQIQILRGHADSYYSNVTNSTFTPEEAIISYSQYLHPRLAYPLPCTMLSQANCRYIQAPALTALLPKLHINRHAPRVVVFGGKTFGGLGLKDYFIDQGYQQLRYLIGHIKLNDDVGQQFLILLSYVQLLTGTSTSVFHQPYQLFKPWIEHTWVSTI
jgi:hypothetical protein